MPLTKFEVRRAGSPFMLSADLGDGRGRRYMHFRTEDAALVAARKLNGDPPPREERLLQLSRDIEALEAWHHAWRLEWDVDYRELHHDDWCAHHRKVRVECSCDYLAYGRLRRPRDVEPYVIRTFSGRAIRSVPADYMPSTLTIEERRAATRTMAKWGSEG